MLSNVEIITYRNFMRINPILMPQKYICKTFVILCAFSCLQNPRHRTLKPPKISVNQEKVVILQIE